MSSQDGAAAAPGTHRRARAHTPGPRIGCTPVLYHCVCAVTLRIVYWYHWS